MATKPNLRYYRAWCHVCKIALQCDNTELRPVVAIECPACRGEYMVMGWGAVPLKGCVNGVPLYLEPKPRKMKK